MNTFYIYVYLDQRYKGEWAYKNHIFNFKPFYIGKGNGKREKAHLCPCMLKEKTLKSSIIKAIINELGTLPLHLRVFESLSETEAFEIEKDMIKHFGRQDIHTGILGNHTDGGEGQSGNNQPNPKLRKKIYQYSLDGNFIKEWSSLSELKNLFGKYSTGNLSTAIKRNGSAYGFLWSYEKMKFLPSKIKYQMPIKYKNIKQIDRKTRKVINVFETALEAERQLNLRPGARCKILECLGGKLRSYLNYEWKI